MNNVSDIDSEVLIPLVKDRPQLWDKTVDEYADRQKTRLAWLEVCELMNGDFRTMDEKDQNIYLSKVMKRWANMRDNFWKISKKYPRAIPGDNISSKYKHRDSLMFLNKIYQSYQLGGSFKEEIEDSDVSDIGAVMQSDVSFEENLPAEAAMPIISNVTSTNSESMDEFECRLLKSLEGGNRHLSFFKGIIPSLQKFSEQEVLEFQIGVLQLVQKIHNRRNGFLHA